MSAAFGGRLFLHRGRVGVGDDRLGDACRGVAAGGRLRLPEQRDALAAAHQQLGSGQHQHKRAVALRHRRTGGC